MVPNKDEVQPRTNVGGNLEVQIVEMQQKAKDQEIMIQDLRWMIEHQGQQMNKQSEVQRLDQLACYYLYLMLTKEERVHRMIDLLWLYITYVIRINVDLPTTMKDFFGRALRINWRLALIKERESKEDKAKGKKTNQGKKKKRNYLVSNKVVR